MTSTGSTPRRGFLSRMAAAVMAAGLPWKARAVGAAQQAGPDDWLEGLNGTHRLLFDFRMHLNGVALINMNSYIRLFETAFDTPQSDINAVGTFYFTPPGASMSLAFTDVMWEKYALGEYSSLVDPQTDRPATRNMFYWPQPGDPLGQRAGIESLQQRGATFLACNNSLGGLSRRLAEAGFGEREGIADDLGANLLPGVILVPAMVIAIDRAQANGFNYKGF